MTIPTSTTCPACADLHDRGRLERDPIHCRRCHSSWTGNEAQHCVKCHATFSSISAADAHRFRRLATRVIEDRCVDPAVTPGWRLKRPGVWTNATTWTGPSR